jgi:hypothetical protein
MPVSRVSLAIAVICVLFFVSCGEHPENESQKPINKLKIAYFWSATNNTYGYASIKAGVRAALEAMEEDKADSPEDFRFLDYVQFEDREDPESQEKAEELAREMRRDPNVLAVIGHAASGTTFAALPRYAEAGIPVLITSATSPYLLYRHSFEAHVPNVDMAEPDYSTPRFPNAFRLIPSDVPDQAHAMELAIKAQSVSPGEDKVSKDAKPKVLLICDATKDSGAEIYSKPICDYLAAPANRREGNYDVVGRTDVDEREVSTILPEIHATHPNFIVVASYSALARLVLQVWIEDKEKLSKGLEPDPQFIMSDACLSPVLLKFNADIYVTYPVNPSHIQECSSRKRYRDGIACQMEKQLNQPLAECSNLRRLNDQRSSQSIAQTNGEDREVSDNQQSRRGTPETDEMFGYDSVLILKEAVRECIGQHDLDRACILRYLNQHHDALKGICETYHVEHGDRQNAYYYVYKNSYDPLDEKKSKWQVIGFAKEDDYELNRANTSASK